MEVSNQRFDSLIYIKIIFLCVFASNTNNAFSILQYSFCILDFIWFDKISFQVEEFPFHCVLHHSILNVLEPIFFCKDIFYILTRAILSNQKRGSLRFFMISQSSLRFLNPLSPEGGLITPPPTPPILKRYPKVQWTFCRYLIFNRKRTINIPRQLHFIICSSY